MLSLKIIIEHIKHLIIYGMVIPMSFDNPIYHPLCSGRI